MNSQRLFCSQKASVVFVLKLSGIQYLISIVNLNFLCNYDLIFILILTFLCLLSSILNVLFGKSYTLPSTLILYITGSYKVASNILLDALIEIVSGIKKVTIPSGMKVI